METKELIQEIKNRGLTGYKIAEDTGLSQVGIDKILNGTTTKPIKKTLEILNAYLNNSYVKENTKQIEVSFLNAETSSIMYVPLVTQYAYGGYLGGFGDNEFVESLPKIPFVLDKEYKGQYLCFEVKGDSMWCENEESIPEGSILLCRNVQKDYWKSKLHINKWDFVIVHQTKGILVKRIINHDVEKGIITIHSLNDYYQDQDLKLKDISQIFNIVEVQQKRKRR